MVQNSSILVKNVVIGDFNPIPLLLLNHRLSAKLAPAFILLCKILTLRKIFEFGNGWKEYNMPPVAEVCTFS